MPPRHNPSSLLRDPAVFTESYLPGETFTRSPKTLFTFYTAAATSQGDRPFHVILHGPPGSGKTLMARKKLASLSIQGVQGIYLNGFETHTLHAILDQILREKKLMHSQICNTEHKFQIFKRRFQNAPFLLVLDEADQLSSKERDRFLYHFSSLPQLGIVLVTRDPLLLFSSDTRIQSRLNPVEVACEPYTPFELVMILRERARLGLVEGSYEDPLLKTIAEKCGGDARMAIQMLKMAALYAQRERSKTIQESHIPEGLLRNPRFTRRHLLQRLSEHHRLLYDLVEEHGEISSPDLQKAYRIRCQKQEKTPRSVRCVHMYLKKLMALELIQAYRGSVKGNVRMFRLCP